ncbi:MAG: hypothetical protein WD708_12670 [Kiritimatiellia bacterium]
MRKIILLVVVLAPVFWIGHKGVRSMAYVKEATLLESPVKRESSIPAGPIVAETLIQQPVMLNPELIRSLQESGPKDLLLLGVNMATYARHDNHGEILLGIVQGDVRIQTTLAVESIMDNALLTVDFPAEKGRKLIGGEAMLFIKGVDSPANKAVTAWLTSDTPFGGVWMNGKRRERGLVVELCTLTYSPKAMLPALGLTITMTFSLLIAAWMLTGSPENQKRLEADGGS